MSPIRSDPSGKRHKAPTITTLGAAFSANKGAASMLYGLIDGIRAVEPNSKFNVMTTYPADDRRSVSEAAASGMLDATAVELYDAGPKRLIGLFFVAVLVRLLSLLRLPPGPLGRISAIRAVREADVVVDLAGISFVDGRGILLLGYNTVMTMFPVLLGADVVKISQAVGPARNLPTRLAAGFVLSRLRAICARGATTRRHLEELGFDTVVDAADISFLMERRAGPYSDPWPTRSDRVRIAVMPSAVVESYVNARGGDYQTILADAIQVLSVDADIVIAPHSWRPGEEESRMNDGPVITGIGKLLDDGTATIINRELDPRELRELAATADVVITSRFHGMISALDVGTPVVVVGWSHKYGEVLDQFHAGEWALSFEEVTSERLVALTEKLIRDRDEVITLLAKSRPQVVQSALRNIAVIQEART